MVGVQLSQCCIATTKRCLLFSTKTPGVPGTHLIDIRRMKGWVDLGAPVYCVYSRRKKNLHWSMIGKLLHIGKNPGKVKRWQTIWELGGKFYSFYFHFSLKTVFTAFKLTKTCLIKMNISFSWRLTRQFNHKLGPLSRS